MSASLYIALHICQVQTTGHRMSSVRYGTAVTSGNSALLEGSGENM